MGQEAKKLSRRDLFKVGTAVAGEALLHPSVVNFAISRQTPIAWPGRRS